MPAMLLVGVQSDGTPVWVAVDGSGRLLIAIPRERTPLKVTRLYAAAGVAPHAGTQRWTYTVPASRKAIVEVLHTEVYRDGAPTTAGRCSVFIHYTPSGGSLTRILEWTQLLTAVGNEKSSDLAPNMLMLAGDVLTASSYDLSTGGTLLIVASAVISEFAA